ncbi:DUF594 family protein [Quillaja saponaria]|uniref:DUF594 family protein n=1 Tax=Quillaja saponaria TaxID=32244 RepID=A0AAD7LNH2_QUISA|nr:DUF594 family protein [Quillaja saponaria]
MMLLVPVLTTWISIEHRRLVQLLPNKVRELWNNWELRGLVLISLLSQIILTILGKHRKSGTNILIRVLVWSSYLTADLVATAGLGVISSSMTGDGGEDIDHQLIAFWAPFLLVHLGGPDTITAYALEDNELWSRHLQSRSSERQGIFEKLSPVKAFKAVENELGYAYDIFYTKASVIYTHWGFISRLFTSIVLALVFLITILKIQKHDLSKMDRNITYILVVGAVLIETISFCFLLWSEWTVSWLERNPASWFPSSLLSCFQTREKWSNRLAQFNLLDFCILSKNKSAEGTYFQKLLKLENNIYITQKEFLDDLKVRIFAHFKKTRIDGNINNVTYLLGHKRYASSNPFNASDRDSDEANRNVSFILMLTSYAEFHERILIWHIATDICFYVVDVDSHRKVYAQASKILSDYMLYLLVKRRYMFPVGSGLIKFRDTCAEIREVLVKRKSITGVDEASRKLLRINTDIPRSRAKGDKSRSVLFDAIRLAKALCGLQEDMWELVTEVWVEILSYAATHCRVDNHAQQLRRGGEFLTIYGSFLLILVPWNSFKYGQRTMSEFLLISFRA